MAKIIPFRGLRYNTQRIANIKTVIAPPYDVIKTDQRIELEQAHPNNIVRLILSQPNETDTDTSNQYTRAASLMNQWIGEGVFIQDTAASYYVYDQTFTTPDGETHTRRALIGIGNLEPFDKEIVFPHEKTLAAPKADRLNLMRQCHANLSPIFLLYSDAQGDIERAMSNYTTANSPVADVSESFGSTHRLWRIDDKVIQSEIRSHFDSKSLVIADGHHRYETALAFRDEIRTKSSSWTGDEGYNYAMMNLVRMESPGLVVLAIHRLLSGLADNLIARAIDQLPKSFSVTTYSNLGSLLENLQARAGKSTAFGIYTRDNAYRLLVPRLNNNNNNADAKSLLCSRLDVTQLHTLVIKELFGLDTTLPEHQTQVGYTVNTEEAIQHVRSEPGRVALLMNPTSAGQVNEVATGGNTMPQKSTYFYPKMATGLVLNQLRN